MKRYTRPPDAGTSRGPIPFSPNTLHREARAWLSSLSGHEVAKEGGLSAAGGVPLPAPTLPGLSDSSEVSRVCSAVYLEDECGAEEEAEASEHDVSVAVFHSLLQQGVLEAPSDEMVLAGLSQSQAVAAPPEPLPAPSSAGSSGDAAFLDFLALWQLRSSFALEPILTRTPTSPPRLFALEVSWGGCGVQQRWTVPLPAAPPPPLAPPPPPPTGSPATWATLPTLHPALFSHLLSFLPSELDFNLPLPHLPSTGSPARVCSAWHTAHAHAHSARHQACIPARWAAIQALLLRPPTSSPLQVVAWDAKGLLLQLLRHSPCTLPDLLSPQLHWQDPACAIWMLDPDAPPCTRQLAAERYLTQEALQGLLASPTGCALAGCGQPSHCTPHTASPSQLAWLLMCTLGLALQRGGLQGSFEGIEMPLLPVLAGMEWRGVGASRARIGRCQRLCGERVCVLEAGARDAVGGALGEAGAQLLLPSSALTAGGRGLRLDHTPALTALLYDTLGVPAAISALCASALQLKREARASAGGGGQQPQQPQQHAGWPTLAALAAFTSARELGSEALDFLASAARAAEREAALLGQLGVSAQLPAAPLARLQAGAALAACLQEWRHVSPLLRAATALKAALCPVTAALHPVYRNATATGRLSLVAPNLQALPKGRHMRLAARLSVWEELQRGSAGGGGGGVQAAQAALLGDPLCLLELGQCAGGAVAALAGGGRSRLVRLLGLRSQGELGEVQFVPRAQDCNVSAYAALHEEEGEEEGEEKGEAEAEEEEEDLVLLVATRALFRLSAPLHLGPAQGGQTTHLCLRRCILPHPGARRVLLFTADYSAAEVRMLAHFSGEPTLRALLAAPAGGDIFTGVAAAWLRKPNPEAVTPQERALAKKLVYGLLYGGGVALLARELQCSAAAAASHAASFFAAFPTLQAFTTACAARAAAEGGVTTVLGRRRLLPHLGSSDPAQRALGARQAVNTLCQGSVADLIKVAMVRIARSAGSSWLGMLLQVHDELLFEVQEDRALEGRELVREAMVAVGHTAGLTVPLVVKLSECSRSWEG